MTPSRPIVLVTGSGGYIGTALVDALASAYRVVGFDRTPERPSPRVDSIACDLTSEESVRNALEVLRRRHGNEIASCVHLAAYYDFSGAPSPLYRTLTVEGTRRLLRHLQDFSVGQFVFSSTHIVMKPAEEEDEVITEASPTEPAWDYPRSKLEAEKVIRKERGTIPAVILRVAGVYDVDVHAVPIAQQMRRIYEKQFESYFFPGDATHGQAFVHLDDLVDAIGLTIARRRDLRPYEVFLIAEPEVMSYAELQEVLGDLIHGKEWPTIRVPKPVAKAGTWVQEQLGGEEGTFIRPWMIDLADDHYPIAIDHARRTLGWEPRRRLRATLPRMVARLKRDPRRWYSTNKLDPPESLPKPLSFPLSLLPAEKVGIGRAAVSLAAGGLLALGVLRLIRR